MKESTLTDKEKEIISQIVADMESGNDLLRPRDEEYKEFRHTLFLNMVQTNTSSFTDHDFEMCDYYWACKEPELMEKYKSEYNIK